MSYYIRDGLDLKEVPIHKVETLINAGIPIISDKDIIKQLKQQLEEAVEAIDILKRLAKSEVILNATMINYSEAFLIAQQFLAKLENKET